MHPLIDLVALDLDGTLLDGNEGISLRNRRAVEATLQAGVRIVLVTGRGADTPERLVRELRLNVPSICAHGALTKDFLSGRTLGHIPVPLQYAVPMIEFAERLGLSIAVYHEEHFHRILGSELYMEDMRGPHWREVPSLLPLLGTAPTFIRFLGHESVEAMREAFSDLPVHFKYETWGDFEECAVTSIEATKKNALERLCGELGVAQENVLAMGDSRNDVPMMRWAGTGVAMGNAPADVIRAVGRSTATCEDDGVARAIERYVLTPLDETERSA